MSVQQEFIDLFVPIVIIEAKFPGGWCGFIQKYPQIYATGWHDWHLFRHGAVHSHQVDRLVEWWQERGLTACICKDEKPKQWVDLCVSSWGKPTLPCSWIAFDDSTGGAYLKGTEPGKLIGPEQMPFFEPELLSGNPV